MSERKTVFITGVGQKNGIAIAKRFAEDGYAVILHDESEQAARKAAEETGIRDAMILGGALCTDEGAADAVKTITGKYKHIDVLINNAGDYPVVSFEDASADDIRSAFRSNVISAMCTSKAVAAVMKKNKGGHIINASRDNAFTADADEFITTMTAWAMRGTTRAMAKQLSKADIKVDAYCAGGDASPEEVANVVAFLASDINADITGQNIMVNRGRFMD